MEEINVAQPTEAVETETPSDPPTEIKEEQGEPSQGGDNTLAEENLPFHKHPRWIQRNREIEELRQTVEELLPLREQVTELSQTPHDLSLPDWWKEAFGDDELSKKTYQRQIEEQNRQFEEWSEKTIQKVYETQARFEQQQNAEVQMWEDHIEDQLQALKDKGYRFNRNELLKIVDDYSKDEEGNYGDRLFPFEKAYEILQLKKSTPTPTDKARQDAASLSVAGTKSGGATHAIPTLTEIRQRGWSGWRTD